MSNPAKTNSLLRYIRHIAAPRHGGHVADAELLERFLTQHDEDAFTTLLRRHGPMVLAVCASIAGDYHLAEDAFQATFLLLAKKAERIRKRASIGSWLHGVARYMSMKARAAALKHRVREGKNEPLASSDPALDLNLRELQAILHEELQRLPEKYRAPVVLCYLEGMTHEQAGRQLGWTPGTVRGRVNRGREMLRGRLTRRGLAVPAALLTLVQTHSPSLAMSGALVSHTLKIALASVTGQAAGIGLISGQVASLVKSGVHAMWLAKLKIATLSALTVGLIGVAAWTVAFAALAVKPTDSAADKARADASVARKEDKGGLAAKDLYGDPLPAGALTRLGTVSLRHGEGIDAIAFSPDGKMIACMAGTEFTTLWDRSTGKEIRRIPEATGRALAFSPDGRLLATAGGRHVRLWDVSAGKKLHEMACQTFTENGNAVSYSSNVPLVFSPDGRMVAAASADQVAFVWDPATGKELSRTAKHITPIGSLRFLPDGKTLVSLSGGRQVDGAIQSWDVATGKEISKAVIHQKTRTSQGFAIAADGKTVAVEAIVPWTRKVGDSTLVSFPGSIRLLDAATGQQRLFIQGKSPVVRNVVFAPDSRCLAWTNMDNEVTIWDAQADKMIHKLRQTPGDLPSGADAIAYDREGKTLATSSYGSALQLWDVVTGKELLYKEAHGNGIRAAVYSPDGRTVASASTDQTIRVWDAKTGKSITKITGHEGAADAIACSPDGRYLATASSDRSVRLWDSATGRQVYRFELANIDLGNGMSQGVHRSVAFTPDSKALIASGSDLKFHKWDLGSGKELQQQSWHLDSAEEPVVRSHVRFSPDGRTAAVTTRKAIHLVDVAGGREFAKLPSLTSATSLAFSADSGTLATGGWDSVLRVWETASTKKTREFKLADSINSVAVSPDGRIVAAGCGWTRASIHLFDVVTGEEVLTFTGLPSCIEALDFAPDVKTLVSAHRDTTGLIWDVAAAYRQANAAPRELDRNELEKLWTLLESEDAAKANATAWALRFAPQSVPAFLKDRLPPAPKVSAEKLQQLIADLDAEGYAKRQSAARELAKFGTDAHAELRQALQGNISLELRRRILTVLDGPTRFVPTLAQLRRIRAIWVLEQIGGKESVAILQSLASGAPAAAETQEAKASLGRLAER